MKPGQNDPCSCGSGLEYKKCCQNKQKPQVPDEVIKFIQDRERKDCERIAQFGHVREPISNVFHGNRIQVSGNTVHYSPHWQYFPDFLLDFVPQVFGKEWGEAEISKPFEQRHPVVQFKQKAREHMKSEEKRGKTDQGYYETTPNGFMAAYMAFAYDLFVAKDNGRLDEEFLQRLKIPEHFQGARHELFAEATCIRANYKIEHEDEKDRSRRHAEFKATHKETGDKISVEAKSKHRPGVLGRPGERQKEDEINLRYGQLINDAIGKKSTHPLVIFVDTNLPPSLADEIFPKKLDSDFEPHRVFKKIFERLRKEYDEIDPFNLIVFTNHPHHYGREDQVDPRKHILSVMPRTPLKPVKNLNAIAEIHRAAGLYGNVPNEFTKN